MNDVGAVFAVARRFADEHGSGALTRATDRVRYYSEVGDQEAVNLWRSVHAILNFWTAPPGSTVQ